MVMVGVLTGTGTGSGTLTVVGPPPDELLLGVVVGVVVPEEPTLGTVVPVVVGNGSEGIDVPVEPSAPVTDPTVFSTGESALTTGFEPVPPVVAGVPVVGPPPARSVVGMPPLGSGSEAIGSSVVRFCRVPGHVGHHAGEGGHEAARPWCPGCRR